MNLQRTRALARAAALALGAVLASCDARSGDAHAARGDVDQLAVLNAATPLIDTMIDAHTQARFQGERRVSASWKVGSARYDLEYRELVSADGQGRFAVEPLDLIEPVLPTAQEDVFLLISRARGGFNWRYRDFRIQHKATFLRNYVVRDAGVIEQHLGFDCASLVVMRRDEPVIVHRLLVELGTGVVLKSRVETRDGELLELAEYQTFQLAPDLTQTGWHQPAVDAIDIADPALPLEIGTGAHAPSLIERSFVLLSAQKVSSTAAVSPNEFARYVYSDGLESIFFLYGGALDAPQPAGNPAEPVLRPDDVVQLAPSVGPWQLAIASIRGERLIAMGRVSHADLLDLIESALY